MQLWTNLAGNIFYVYFLVYILSSISSMEYNSFILNTQERQPWHNIPYRSVVRRQSYPYNEYEYEPRRPSQSNTLNRITETLDALNKVGRYLVNMTKGASANINQEIPSAIYTVSKNVLGRNITDSIAPYVREAISTVTNDRISKKEDTVEHKNPRACTTSEGSPGYCNDLSDCPQLLINLGNLRESLCFKSLFEPGVCCPQPLQSVTLKPITAIKSTTVKSIKLSPVTTTKPYTTKTPFSTRLPATTTTTRPFTTPFILPPDGNIVDPQDCGQIETTNFRVVGGEEAIPGEWPWMAAIFLTGLKRTEFWCGGSLISAKHVLTAAHCTRDGKQKPFAKRQFFVRLGDVDLKSKDEPSDPVDYKVADIRVHNQFSRIGFYNDIAIFVLDRPARKSKYVIPLCLPPPELRYNDFAGKKAIVVGWGTTYYGGKESTVQRKAVLPIWRNEDCNQAYFQPITKNFICAGYSEGGTDACQGDSGGPLMLRWDARWMQIGVVSFGNKCGEPGYPGVYTRITEYINWINENTK